ncbi:hypothetical protein ABKU46_23260, partial (plasmid) [Enterobacter hormaechei]
FEKSRASVVYITTAQLVRDVWTRNVFSVPRATTATSAPRRQSLYLTSHSALCGFQHFLLASAVTLLLALLAASPPRRERQWPPRVISSPRLRVHLR